jgi:hypothetical protein
MTDKLQELALAVASTTQMFLGHDAAMARTRCQQMTLFQVMALSRVRDSKSFAWWGAIVSVVVSRKLMDHEKTLFF